jgi:hypothetical protein
MPPKFSRHYEQLFTAFKDLGELNAKNKAKFMQILTLWRQEFPLDTIQEEPEPKPVAKKGKGKKRADTDETGEPTARKRIVLIKPDSGKKGKVKKQTSTSAKK